MIMQRRIRIIASVLLLMTILWIVFMILSTAPIDPDWRDQDFVRWAAEKGFAYLVNYINVSLLTLVVVLLFSYFYVLLKEVNEPAAIAGLLFIPIYGIMNLSCYSMQITLVPNLAAEALANQESLQQVVQLIQAKPGSIMGYINGLAYAILGIPSIIYGLLLIRSSYRLSGLFLGLNGIFCLLGIVGYLLSSDVLSLGIMAGGILFLISLICMIFEFAKPVKTV